MLKGRSLLDYRNLFSAKEYEKNNKTLVKYFQYLKKLRWKKYIVLLVVSKENVKKLKHHTYLKKR